MDELGEEGRVLLDLAREVGDPNDEDRRRVRAGLVGRLGAAAGLGAAGWGASGKAAFAGSTLGTKLIVTALVVGASVGGGASIVHSLRHVPGRVGAGASSTRVVGVSPPEGLVALRTPDGPDGNGLPVRAAPPSSPRSRDQNEIGPALVERAAATARPSAARAATKAPGSAGARVGLPQHREARADGLTADARPAEVRRPATQDRGATPVALPFEVGSQPAQATETSTPTLANEARLVHDAVAALRAGQAARALALCDAHAIFYRHGVLAEECAAQRVLALADLGRVAEARAAGDAFLRVHPTSPLATRLRLRLRTLDVPPR